jgi:protein ImuA
MILPAATTLAALRRSIAALEAVTPSFAPARPTCAHGLLRFCGAIPLAASLHEVAALSESEMAAATGFTLPLAAWAAAGRTILWIAEDMALAESGALYGPALDDVGVPPERLIRVAVTHPREVPWAMEEALHCRSVGAVIGEMRGIAGEVGLIASRRLSLAAGRDGVAAFLLRSLPSDEPIAAATRWIVGVAPSQATAHGPGPPRLNVRLTRNRRGSLGSWMVEWNSVEQRFELAADRQSLAEKTRDRSSQPAASA